MLLPGGLLMVVVIIVPLLLGVLISLLDLDQYTLRSWLQRAVRRARPTSSRRSRTRRSLRSVWLSVAFAVIVTAVTLPIGVAAALATQNPFRGRGLVRSIFLIPTCCRRSSSATMWRTMLQPERGRQHLAARHRPAGSG